jgi:hypothetical protein
MGPAGSAAFPAILLSFLEPFGSSYLARTGATSRATFFRDMRFVSLPRFLLVTFLASCSGTALVFSWSLGLMITGLAADRAAARTPRALSIVACLSALCGVAIVSGRQYELREIFNVLILCRCD